MQQSSKQHRQKDMHRNHVRVMMSSGEKMTVGHRSECESYDGYVCYGSSQSMATRGASAGGMGQEAGHRGRTQAWPQCFRVAITPFHWRQK